jgi:hypothetical protein
MLNNAFLGMTVQKYICQKYNVEIPSEAVAQFSSNYNEEYTDGLDHILKLIFWAIGQNPKVCTTFVPSAKAKETLSPHNFILTDGSTLSIRTNKNGDKVAPRVVGQCGLYVFNSFFSELAGYEVEDKNDIKQIVYDNIDKMLPTFLDYLFVSDYTVWLRRDDDGKYDFTIFYRNTCVNIDLEREHFSFTKEGNDFFFLGPTTFCIGLTVSSFLFRRKR